MASIDQFREPGGEVHTCYNVDMAVGRNAPNVRDDVLLVQYFLKRIYEKPVYETGSVTPQQGKMVLDGICGPTTLSWIGHFQLDMHAFGYNCVVDQRVDRARGTAYSSISQTVYTILVLNNAFMRHYPEIFADMANHPDVPAQVRASLLRRPQPAP